jgi:hypothetical protein
MPIRFFCEHCRQMLKIGTSKMGSVVDCPRCHKSVVVPPQSTPQAEQLYLMLKNKRSEATASPKAVTPPIEEPPVSEPEPSVPESAWDELGGEVDDADLNRWIDDLWTTMPENQRETTPAHPTLMSMPNPITSDEVALITLQKRYQLTATLLYVSTAVAFFFGIILGIGVHALFFSPSRTHQHGVNREQTSINEVTGMLYYLNKNGERLADADAVVICLPKDRSPSPLFSCQGLRPEDTLNNDTVQLIHELGGIYERADANGSFTLAYREGIRYFVVLLSAHQTRADGVVKPSTLQELRRYFRDPELLGEHCLRADEYEWSGGTHSLGRHTFESVE